MTEKQRSRPERVLQIPEKSRKMEKRSRKIKKTSCQTGALKTRMYLAKNRIEHSEKKRCNRIKILAQ